MLLQTFSYRASKGWSAEPRADLDSEQTVVLAFGASGFMDDPRPVAELVRRFPRSLIAGCSTSGEILGPNVSDDTFSVGVLRLESGRIATIATPVKDASESRAVGATIARALAGPDLRGVLIFSDGLGVNGTDLAAGINAGLPPSVITTGGLAGDGDRFKRTWVIADGRAQTGMVSAVGFYGDRVRMGHGSKGGWDIFGPERVVTRSRGNVLFALDDRPALQLYKEYLGDRAAGLPATALLFPLALRASRDDGTSVVRTVLAVDEAEQSMTFAGDIPQGHLAQLMKANFDRLVQGASEAALMIERPAAAANTMMIAISCVGRRLVLGERIEEETEATLDAMPGGTEQIGFYSYGELSPHANGQCDLHNQTMTLTTIYEV